LRVSVTVLKALAIYKHETTLGFLSVSLYKNIHFLYLPFVTISMYLADAWPLAPQARPVGRHTRPTTRQDMRHLCHHLMSQRLEVFRSAVNAALTDK
jgi:hypothetical protein